MSELVDAALADNSGTEPGALFRSGVSLGDETTGSPEFLAWADDRMRELIVAAYQTQGVRAFESTRHATAIHEAGHAIIFRWAGREVSRIRLCCRNGSWIGITEAATTGCDLLQAYLRIAGVTAELLFDEDFRHGSSLNEVVVFNAACSNAAYDMACSIIEVQRGVISQVTKISRRNEHILRDIAARLMQHKTLNAKQIAALLQRAEVVALDIVPRESVS
jgi:hypothetical protein